MKARLPVFAVMAALVLVMSCASKPKEAPKETPKAVPKEVIESRAQAEAARKKAFDLGVKDVLPDDYAAAEAAYQKGLAAERAGDYKAAEAAYKDAAARFSAATQKGLPLLADSWRAKAEAMRSSALKKGADKSFAGQLASADAGFAAGKTAQGNKEYEAAIAAYKSSLYAYETLYRLCEARDSRDDIVRLDLAKWDGSNWKLAEGKYQEAQTLFAKDPTTSRADADEALLRYNRVKKTAADYYLKDRKSASNDAMKKALSIKGDVALPVEFSKAADIEKQAAAKEAAGDYAAAAELYTKSADSFNAVYAKAKVLMDEAKAKIDALDAKLKQ